MSEYLMHSGVKGMKWGIRRYQNEDGTLTDAGKKRYGYGSSKGSFQYERKHNRAYNELRNRYDKFDNSAKRARAVVNRSSNPTANQRYTADVMEVVASIEKQCMNKSLKELGMGKKEIAYREAGYNYSKHLQGNVGARLAANAVAGPLGTLAYVGVRAASPEGRRLSKEYKKAHSAYKG